ncbi:hypothetical protein [Absidia glauca]|uniref:Eisosome component PIL1-domain-containing protein n=1 Tax=Absidia glauca TaxID=4829 RepID=A0A168R8C5_ABSGL|nr:hypothetical protein [Absidia glauca]
MNFKDLQFSLGKLSSDVKSHMAKKNPLHKQDTKALSVWIFQERNDLATMRTLAYRRGETNKSFREWTTNGHEYWNDDDEFTDLQDIGDKLATLLTKANEVEQHYTARYQQYRHAIKAIREREDALCDDREKRRSLSARLAHLQKTNQTSPKRHEIETELAALDNDTQRAEIELGDFKRFALKEAFYIRFNAMVEYAEKMKMIGGFGKYIVDLLDVEPTTTTTGADVDTPSPPSTTDPATSTTTPVTHPSNMMRKPYTSETQATLILNDCLLALDQWAPSEDDERPTLANQAIHDAFDDEDANLLTEDDIKYYREQGLASLTSSSPSPVQQPPIYDGQQDKNHQQWNEKMAHSMQQNHPDPSLAALKKKDEARSESERNKNSATAQQPPPAYSPSISKVPSTPSTTTTETAAAGLVSSGHNEDARSTNPTSSLSQSSFSSAHVYHPELEGCQLDYYQVYRNKLLHPSHQPRPYSCFQQQFASGENSKASVQSTPKPGKSLG